MADLKESRRQDGEFVSYFEKYGSIAALDREVLERCGLEAGAELAFGVFTALVQERILGPGLRREICGSCQWDGICGGQPSRWADK